MPLDESAKQTLTQNMLHQVKMFPNDDYLANIEVTSNRAHRVCVCMRGVAERLRVC